MATAAVVPLTGRSLSASCIAPTFMMSWPSVQYFPIAAFMGQSTLSQTTFRCWGSEKSQRATVIRTRSPISAADCNGSSRPRQNVEMPA